MKKKVNSSELKNKKKPTTTKHSSHLENTVRVRRIEGQVRGVLGMIEREEYCIDIISQIRAARSALASVESRILAKHLKHCLYAAFESGDDSLIGDKVDELVKMTMKLSK